jgi:hypothetical protein
MKQLTKDIIYGFIGIIKAGGSMIISIVWAYVGLLVLDYTIKSNPLILIDVKSFFPYINYFYAPMIFIYESIINIKSLNKEEKRK